MLHCTIDPSRHLRTSFAPVLLLLLMPLAAFAQMTGDSSAATSQTASLDESSGLLRVGVPIRDPICFRRGQDFDGIAIDLWREIYSGTGQKYEFFAVDSPDPLTPLKQGRADVILGVRPVSSAIGEIRYTQPFVTSSLAYATSAYEPSLSAYTSAFFNRRLAWVAFWVCCILLVVGILCWIAERRGNSKQFRRLPHHGIWDGFYWAGVTMTTIGYGDKVPTTTLGKVVALFWMLAAIGVSSVLTASIVSVVNQVREEAEVRNFPGDLSDKKVVAVDDSSAAAFLENHRIEFDGVKDLERAMKMLREGSVDAVVDTDIRLKAKGTSAGVVIRSTWLRPQGYTIAVPVEADPLLTQLDQAILRQTSQPDWNARIKRYTGN